MTSPSRRISRRTFLANASMAALAWRTSPLEGTGQLRHHRRPHPQRKLRGQSIDRVNIFRGVPFAEPPVGPLRFRPTIASKPWTGERDATRFAASAMQWREGTAFGELPFVHSEDCLYLNIWAPEGKGPFPVFVWIHGGGYISGHAFGPIHDGSEFARQGIISVTLPYRLGVFGFLDLGPLLDSKSGPEYNGSANNALRDLITALEWVQRNISAFGGDPDRVTIGGESAGAKLTDILMGIPSAQPLFHQMISESGGAERVWSKAAAAAVSHGYGELWRKQSGQDLGSLKTAPAEALIATQHDFLIGWPQHFPLRPEIDDQLLPQMPVKAIAAGSSKAKRLLIGTNHDESALFIGPHPDIDPAPKDLGNLPLAKFNPVFERYKRTYPDMKAFQTRIRAVTAEEYWVPSIRVADALVEGEGTVFMYRLDFTESSGHLSGFAYHSLDVPLVWDRPHPNAANLNQELALGKQVHVAWAAFIRGEPRPRPASPPGPNTPSPIARP